MSFTTVFYICMVVLAWLVYASFTRKILFNKTVCGLPVYAGYVMLIFFFFTGWVSWIPLLIYGILAIIVFIIWSAIIGDRERQMNAANKWNNAIDKGIGAVFGKVRDVGPKEGEMGSIFNAALGGVENYAKGKASWLQANGGAEVESAITGKLANAAYILALGIHLFINRI